MLVRRSASRVTSSRVGMLTLVRACAMLACTALRKGPEPLSQASSITAVAWAYASVLTSWIIIFDQASMLASRMVLSIPVGSKGLKFPLFS